MRVFVAIAAIGLLSGCAPAHSLEQEALHARVESGCGTSVECAALYAEVQQRWAACVNESASRGGGDCNALLHDKIRAADMVAARQKEEADVTAASRKTAADDGTRRFIAERMRDEQERSRRAQSEALRSEIESTISNAESDVQTLPGKERPSDMLVRVDETASRLKDLASVDASASAILEPRVATWATTIREGVAKEDACRATPLCVAGRVGLAICSQIALRQVLHSDIARERANPAGVIDLAALHDLGQRVQRVNDVIAEQRKNYAALAKKQFNDASCAKSSNASP